MTQIDKTLNLLALTSIWERPFKEQILLMSRSGFEPKEIAELLNTTSNTVSVRLSEMKKRGGKKLKESKYAE